jgi:hypothetical protein
MAMDILLLMVIAIRRAVALRRGTDIRPVSLSSVLFLFPLPLCLLFHLLFPASIRRLRWGQLSKRPMSVFTGGITFRLIASVAIAAEKALKETGHPGGIGLYKSFVHVDVRSMKYRWDQRSGKEVAVSGF